VRMRVVTKVIIAWNSLSMHESSYSRKIDAGVRFPLFLVIHHDSLEQNRRGFLPDCFVGEVEAGHCAKGATASEKF
jgi:hypothetical protein